MRVDTAPEGEVVPDARRLRELEGENDGRQGPLARHVFIERVWRSIKYEEVYLHAYETMSAAREDIGRYINFDNTCRPHSSHQARTPDAVYFASLPQPSAEAA